MEIISFKSPPRCNPSEKFSIKRPVKLPYVRIYLPGYGSSKISTIFHVESSIALNRSKMKARVSAVNYDGYVVDGDETAAVPTQSGSKILIPGLPDEDSASVEDGFWEWKPKLNVHYEKSGCENVTSPPILLLPGFGAGSFHYENQLKDLGREYRVWALDLLGLGLSLPIEDPAPRSQAPGWGFGDKAEPWAQGLAYSTDLWCDQVRYFIEEVIGEPVYIVGNSLGGFVALSFAACNPHLVKGVTLVNATPFWGFLPNPITSPRLARFFSWRGEFPLPENVRKLIEFIWEKVSDPENIAAILRQVYADHTINVDKVFSRIIAAAQHPAAAAAFASIMFAPKGQLSFKEALSRSHMNKVPICLICGKEDPWVKPIWGRLVKKQVPEVLFYEISPAGHCPHDEVPEVVNYLLSGWMRSLESGGFTPLPLLEHEGSIDKSVAKDLEFLRKGARKSINVKLYGSIPSWWALITSNFSSFAKLQEKPR